MRYSVRDGMRTLHFEGELLAESSSRIGTRPRWVEFKLYKTPAETYILSRVGVSIFFHAGDCQVVSRNRLSAVDGAELPVGSVPCPDCTPNLLDMDGVYPETPRFWAQSSAKNGRQSGAIGVIASLMKYDENGTEYLTNVARRLLEDASEVDEDLASAYASDYIE